MCMESVRIAPSFDASAAIHSSLSAQLMPAARSASVSSSSSPVSESASSPTIPASAPVMSFVSEFVPLSMRKNL